MKTETLLRSDAYGVVVIRSLIIHTHQFLHRHSLHIHYINVTFLNAACDPAQLGESPTSFNGSGTIVVSNGIVQYNGVAVGSTAVLICNKGYTSKLDSGNRTCNSDGNWSGSPQICDLAQGKHHAAEISILSIHPFTL